MKNRTEERRVVEQGLTVKVSGSRKGIEQILETLERFYVIVATSRFVPNREDPSTFHIFVNMFAKKQREETIEV